jgi:hypothetical protein
MSAFSLKMHVGIWLDGITGTAVLLVAGWMLWHALASRPRASTRDR